MLLAAAVVDRLDDVLVGGPSVPRTPKRALDDLGGRRAREEAELAAQIVGDRQAFGGFPAMRDGHSPTPRASGARHLRRIAVIRSPKASTAAASVAGHPCSPDDHSPAITADPSMAGTA